MAFCNSRKRGSETSHILFRSRTGRKFGAGPDENSGQDRMKIRAQLGLVSRSDSKVENRDFFGIKVTSGREIGKKVRREILSGREKSGREVGNPEMSCRESNPRPYRVSRHSDSQRWEKDVMPFWHNSNSKSVKCDKFFCFHGA